MIGSGLLFRDLLSTLILVGFAFMLLGALTVSGGLVWTTVALVRRRGRAVSVAFLWSSFSVLVVGLVGVAILAPRPPSVPTSMSSPAELDAFLERLVDSGNPPSISVVVMQDGQTVYSSAFGDRDGAGGGSSATPETVYHWYSVTKIVTAIATMQLVDQGLVSLDDPVSDYLPFFEPEYPSPTSG